MTIAQTLPEHFRWQAEWCGKLGSPLYANLLGRAADDIEAKGPIARVLGDREATTRSALALKLMGGIHRLVLRGEVPDLAAAYPSAGGQADPEGAWRALMALVEERFDDVDAGIERPVQTNEVGRATALVVGFLEAARVTTKPLSILEVGTSAGLLLRWDHFLYEARGLTWGPPESPVRLCSYNSDLALPFDTKAEVVARAGCDASPVDPTTDEGRITLLSYVWPDQITRLRQLRAALSLAAEVPAAVERVDARQWTEERFRPQSGVATVLFHSIVMQYLPDDDRRAFKEFVRARGAEATADAPLAWLRFEPGGAEANVRLTLWPGGHEAALAESGFHGQNTRYLGPHPGLA